MVETIAPVVYGRRRRYLIAVALHALAAVVTGALTGALLGTAGWMLGAPWDRAGYFVLAGIALLYLAREALGAPVPLPQLKRQVPEWWRRFYGPVTAATLYGAGLGVGFATYLSFGTYAAVAAGAFLIGDPLLGAAACGAFGAARGLGVLVGARARDAEMSAAVVEGLGSDRARTAGRAVNAVVLGGLAAAVLASL
jgi:hypothetical protein